MGCLDSDKLVLDRENDLIKIKIITDREFRHEAELQSYLDQMHDSLKWNQLEASWLREGEKNVVMKSYEPENKTTVVTYLVKERK